MYPQKLRAFPCHPKRRSRDSLLGVGVSPRKTGQDDAGRRAAYFDRPVDNRLVRENHHILAAVGVLRFSQPTPRTRRQAASFMPRTYAKNLVHCVYSTKNRVPSIKSPERTWQITREIARNIDIDIIAIGGVSDHIHLLMSLPPSGPWPTSSAT